MSHHIFKSGPRGTCQTCGKIKSECERGVEILYIGEQEDQTNKYALFYKQIPDSCLLVQIQCSRYNCFLQTRSGDVFSFGAQTNTLGRVVTSTEEARLPGKIKQFVSNGVIFIAAGLDHVLALDSTNNVWAWGDNSQGQLGILGIPDSSQPVKVKGIQYAIRLYCGVDWSMAICSQDFCENKRGMTHQFKQYVWGNNSNYKLGYLANDLDDIVSNLRAQDAFRLLQPTEVVLSPLKVNQQLALCDDNRQKNYLYYSDTNLGVAIGGISQMEIFRTQTENQHLKRTLEKVVKGIKENEIKLYGEIIPDGFAWGPDQVLDDIYMLQLRNTNIIDTRANSIVLKNQKINQLTEEITDIEEKIVYLNREEMEILDKIESQEVYQMLSISKLPDEENLFQLEEIPIAELQEQLTENSQVKKDLQTQLRQKQEELQQCNCEIQKFKDEKKGAQSRLASLEKMTQVREEQLAQEFFDKNQNGILESLDEMSRLHEALIDTEPEQLSTSMPLWKLGDFLKESNQVLSGIGVEIQRLKRPEGKRGFSVLNEMTELLSDNLQLRKQINDYLEGSILQSSDELFENFNSMEECYNFNSLQPFKQEKVTLNFENDSTTENTLKPLVSVPSTEGQSSAINVIGKKEEKRSGFHWRECCSG